MKFNKEDHDFFRSLDERAVNVKALNDGYRAASGSQYEMQGPRYLQGWTCMHGCRLEPHLERRYRNWGSPNIVTVVTNWECKT